MSGNAAGPDAATHDHNTGEELPPTTVQWARGEGLEPGDAYMESGFLVFTAQYHLRRGYCCNSGCRHCPYR